MNKELLKSSWMTAAIILLIGTILGWIFIFIFSLFNLETANSLPSILSVIIASMAVGMIYTKNFNEIMPKKQRLNSAIIYAVLSLILAFLFSFGFLYDKVLFIIMIISSVIMSAVSIAVIHYFLKLGGGIYINSKKQNGS